MKKILFFLALVIAQAFCKEEPVFVKEVLDMLPYCASSMILTAAFCRQKSLWTLDELPHSMTPYVRWLWKVPMLWLWKFCSNCDIPATLPGVTCNAYFIRYHWNNSLQECEEVIYGGCRATINNFETREECEKIAGRVCRVK